MNSSDTVWPTSNNETPSGVHRVSIQAFHERLGPHLNKDAIIRFYEDNLNMPANIYIQVFSDGKEWCRAQRLIIVFPTGPIDLQFLSAWIRERNEIGRAPEVLRAKATIISKVGTRRANKKQAAVAISAQALVLVGC